jgi:hypothetical protein
LTLQLGLAVRGDLRAWTKEVANVVDAGGRAALRRATFGLRNNVRGRIRRAGFKSGGLAKAVAAKVSGRGLDLEGRVYSVARYKAGGFRRQSFDLIALFSEETTITPAGNWLVIPTGEGPRKAGRGDRSATPGELEAMGWKIAVIPAKRAGNLVVVASWPGAAGARVVTHVLVPRVTLRSRYDLQGAINLWVPRLPELLATEINKRADASPTLMRE